MDFLGIFFFLLVALFALNIYCIHMCNKLNDEIDTINAKLNVRINNELQYELNKLKEKFLQTSDNTNSQNNRNNQNNQNNQNKEINIYYGSSPSSLIEVSSDDNSLYDEDYDDEYEYDPDGCEIKNVHMSLELENLEDIHVLLLDEVSEDDKNANEVTVAKEIKNDVLENIKSDELVDELNLDANLKADELNLDANLKVDNSNLNVDISNTKTNSTNLKVDELNFKPKKRESRESRKNIENNDYKKMNLTELRKYVSENNINLSEISKMKKPEILKAIEEIKNIKESNVGELIVNELIVNELNNDNLNNNNLNNIKSDESELVDLP